MYDISILIT